MSLALTVEFRDSASAAFAGLREGLGDGQALHAAMGFAVGESVRGHLKSAGYLGRRNRLGGKSTGFWKAAAESIGSEATEDGATVAIRHRGVALRYFGGIVTPKTRKALSVPVHKSAHGLNASEYPGLLAFIPAARAFGPFRSGQGQDTIGYLVRGVERTITRGPNKGKTRVVPIARPAGELIYVLRSRTYHEPDKGILPTDEAMVAAAAEAGADYLDAIHSPN